MGKEEEVEEVVEKKELVAPLPPSEAKVEEKEVVDEPKVVKRKKYVVGSIATQTEPVILLGDEQFTIHEAIALLLNKIDEVGKAVL